MKRNVKWVLTTLLILGTTLPAMAADPTVQASGMWIFFGLALACGFAIGIAAFGTGLGMGNSINAALTGIARNPEATGKIQTNLILGLAFIESLCIYALLICFMMVLKIPSFEVLLGK
ncbi:MAG: ATP synthase F0 subunit C [Desulfobacteraceae bacterium]|nr:MAG: ATP synthase F0 subunit C [Desulfobacteraceae bacterium]